MFLFESQLKPVVDECDLRVHSVLRSQHDLGVQIEHLNCGEAVAHLQPTVSRLSVFCACAARARKVHRGLLGAGRGICF
jgi:hypothetical protein